MQEELSELDSVGPVGRGDVVRAEQASPCHSSSRVIKSYVILLGRSLSMTDSIPHARSANVRNDPRHRNTTWFKYLATTAS